MSGIWLTSTKCDHLAWLPAGISHRQPWEASKSPQGRKHPIIWILGRMYILLPGHTRGLIDDN